VVTFEEEVLIELSCTIQLSKLKLASLHLSAVNLIKVVLTDPGSPTRQMFLHCCPSLMKKSEKVLIIELLK